MVHVDKYSPTDKQRPYHSQWEKRTFMRLKLLHTQQGTKETGKENKSEKQGKEKPPPTDEALQEQ